MLETAQTYFQQKKYDLCLLSLHTLAQAGGTDESEAQALSVICKIHKHAALQEWHKVASHLSPHQVLSRVMHVHWVKQSVSILGFVSQASLPLQCSC